MSKTAKLPLSVPDDFEPGCCYECPISRETGDDMYCGVYASYMECPIEMVDSENEEEMKCNVCGNTEFAYVNFIPGITVQVCHQPVDLFACTKCGTIRVNDETLKIIEEHKNE